MRALERELSNFFVIGRQHLLWSLWALWMKDDLGLKLWSLDDHHRFLLCSLDQTSLGFVCFSLSYFCFSLPEHAWLKKVAEAVVTSWSSEMLGLCVLRFSDGLIHVLAWPVAIVFFLFEKSWCSGSAGKPALPLTEMHRLGAWCLLPLPAWKLGFTVLKSPDGPYPLPLTPAPKTQTERGPRLLSLLVQRV